MTVCRNGVTACIEIHVTRTTVLEIDSRTNLVCQYRIGYASRPVMLSLVKIGLSTQGCFFFLGCYYSDSGLTHKISSDVDKDHTVGISCTFISLLTLPISSSI